ncbi:MoxR-like ATPase [Deinococcus aetherius]|uniref:MoxR-like ATPase n=1 Tax=Deinococcus aetherius TaxID=200252 RepID=A0ABN6RFL2_9DEIO|nr:AAA family ATPase [Deinococcus aetherius]BDP40496.1 MoxR-like ATPase [Deinococcus aetherius]
MTAPSPLTPLSPQAVTNAAARLRTLLFEVKKVIVGQDLLLERLLVALLARGHVLVEGVPGLAKTLAIKTTADAIGASFRRIQFTPDLVPADLIGTRIYNQKTGAFEVELGPVVANLILADEINRAPAKIQSALLEAMQERQVTIGSQTFPLPDPFLVLATQNPIESEGTYFLPEAQVDRFMFKVVVGYPGFHEEMTVVERVSSSFPPVGVQLSGEELRELQRMADLVYVHPAVTEYAVTLARATRDPAAVRLPDLARAVAYGASPRASVNLILGAKALAVVRGREYALPEDVRDLAPEVLRHRVMLSYEGLAEEIRIEEMVGRLIAAVPLPRVHLGDPTGASPPVVTGNGPA